MRKIRTIVTGAGGSAAIGFCRSLRDADIDYEIIGLDCDKYHLCLAEVDFKYLIPRAEEQDYIPIINHIADKHQADFLHAQPDVEIEVLSENRGRLRVKTNLPRREVVQSCLNKFTSYELWRRAGMTVPETLLIENRDDLKRAFEEFKPELWIRNVKGAAGRGALRTRDFDEAVSWIDFCRGWGEFTASECLTENTITWQSLWKEGQLIVAQTRLRKYWEFSNRSPSGVTGLTGTGVTMSDRAVDDIASRCIYAVDDRPNAIFSVDMTYDKNGTPNPTEINIGRFFTTHYFFTKAGLNFPDIYVRSSLGMDVDLPEKKINPLENDLAWVRGLDSLPLLTTLSDIERSETQLQELKNAL
ncbi:MAG: carboxylate--amine ligase [Thermodesulfobacteriota bacterium]|nr:carboxylate--amine ligase [Thermodesulfobacteriota bacterium]